MKHPAVSVLIPVYNAEKFLSTCLRSLQEQTFTDFEVLCINDGSKDQSQKSWNNLRPATRVSAL